MAENKKSIIVYADWINKFEELSDEEAGRLIKHFFRYVNDLNPEPPDRITKLMFVDIKSTLKRDLNKYSDKKEARSKAGKLGNLKKYHDDLYKKVVSEEITLYEAISIANSRKGVKSVAKLADNDNGSGSGSGSVNDSDNDILLEKETKEIKFNFKNSLKGLDIDEKIISEWLSVRRKKKATNSETAFNKIKSEIDKSGLSANNCIKLSVENSWSGFNHSWLKNIKPTSENKYKGNR